MHVPPFTPLPRLTTSTPSDLASCNCPTDMGEACTQGRSWAEEQRLFLEDGLIRELDADGSLDLISAEQAAALVGKMHRRSYARKGDAGSGLSVVRFLAGCNGPPGIVHGGAVMLATELACSDLARFTYKAHVQVRGLEVSYKAPITFDCCVRVESKVASLAGGAVTMSATFRSLEGKVLCVGTCTVFATESPIPRGDWADEADVFFNRSGRILSAPGLSQQNEWKANPHVQRLRSANDRYLEIANDSFRHGESATAPSQAKINFLDERVHVQFFRDFQHHSIVGAVTFLPAFGFRAHRASDGHAHPGFAAGVMDVAFVALCGEVLSASMAEAGGITAVLQASFMSSVPLDQTLRVEAAVTRIGSKVGSERKKIFMSAKISAFDTGAELCTSSTLFLANGTVCAELSHTLDNGAGPSKM
jgi:acyl-coenzyme A thioesterase PaaI-like protein